MVQVEVEEVIEDGHDRLTVPIHLEEMRLFVRLHLVPHDTLGLQLMEAEGQGHHFR